MFLLAFTYQDRYKAQRTIRDVISNLVREYAREVNGGIPLRPDSPSLTLPAAFELIDPPSLAELPVRPNRLIVVAVGLCAGLLSGAIAVRVRPRTARV